MKIFWLSGKEKVSDVAVSKEGHAVTVLQDMKGLIIIDFF